MLSLDAAYDTRIAAAAKISARQKDHRTTTSLAPELGLREFAHQKHQRGYERHDGGRSLLMIWRQSENDRGTVQQFLIGITLRRDTVDFADSLVRNSKDKPRHARGGVCLGLRPFCSSF